jgi:ferredoxin-type protein NapH
MVMPSKSPVAPATGPRVAPSIGRRQRGWLGVGVQRWRQLTQGGFFLLFILAPVFDLFRLDLNLKHFILFGMDWTLGLEAFTAGQASAADAALALLLRAFLPVLGLGATLIYVSWRWGRLYCGWLCPHFSVVETINQTLRRAIGKQSLWDKQPMDERNADGSRSKPDAIWWFGVMPLVIGFSMLWAVVLLTYLLPPAEIYGNIWHATLTRNQTIFLSAATCAFFVEFMFARHLFCRYACAVGLFQSLAWMGNDKAMVVGFGRERAKDCASCFSACDHICPMRLNPRSVKRMMFACVQCGQCVDACNQTQSANADGPLLGWVNEARAESEAALTGSQARHRQIEIVPLRAVPRKPEEES